MTVVIIVYFSVTRKDVGEQGHCFPCFFKREATGAEVTFHSSITGNFMVKKIFLKQVYCSCSRTHKIQNGFLHFLVLFLRSKFWLNRSKHVVENFLFFISLYFPQPCVEFALHPQHEASCDSEI